MDKDSFACGSGSKENNATLELLYKSIEASRNEVKQQFSALNNKLDSLINRIDHIEESHKLLDTRLTMNEDTTHRIDEEVKEVKSELSDALLTLKEQHDRMRRKNNIIAYDIPDSAEGESLVMDLLNVILPNLCMQPSMERIGKPVPNAKRPRPLRIVLPNQIERRNALQNCRRLKGLETFAKISIKPDLTRNQQNERRTPPHTRSQSQKRQADEMDCSQPQKTLCRDNENSAQ